MRKRKKGRKLGRKRNQRRALSKTLASALILNEKIKTTNAKAKELSPFIEKLITKAKIGDLQTRRFLLKFFSEKIVKKIIEEIVPR